MKEIIKQKQQIVAEITEKFKRAKSILLVDYRGINVAQDTKLRKTMRDAGIDYKVYKNRLAQRAMSNLGYDALNAELQDTTAIAVSYDDVVAPSKIVAACGKEFNKLSIKAGVVEGVVTDKKGMEALATIPPREVLIAQVLGMLTMPMRGLAVVLSEIAKKQA